MLIALCFNTLQSVSDSAVANPVVKANQITVLENLMASILMIFYSSLLNQHSKCERISPIHVDKKGFFSDPMAFYTCPALETD